MSRQLNLFNRPDCAMAVIINSMPVGQEISCNTLSETTGLEDYIIANATWKLKMDGRIVDCRRPGFRKRVK